MKSLIDFTDEKGIVMLVVTRKLQESVEIGKDIRIKIVGILGNKVRIGISAPPDVVILREEVAERARKIADALDADR